jgi:hypothetical protein
MDRNAIEDRQVMERYLQGKLTADEEQAFEESYLANPDMLDDLILTEKLQQGLKDVDSHGRVGRGSGRIQPRQPVWLRALSSPRYAAAATVLLGVSLLFSVSLLVQNENQRPGIGLAGDPAVTRLLPLVAVRGNRANVVAAPAADEWTVFLLDAGFNDFEDYRATLTRRGPDTTEQIWQFDGLSPTYDGTLALGLPGRVLTPGEYEIALEGKMRDWPAERGFELITRTPLNVAPAD